MDISSPSTGRVQIVNGVLYYSPNSPVEVRLNLDELPVDVENPFKPDGGHRPTVHYGDFIHPRPWTRTFGWMSFIPAVPWDRSSSALVGVLARYPPILQFTNDTQDVHGYRLPVSNVWEELEDDVYAAVVALKNRYHTPCILPFLPKALGFRNMHSRDDWLKACIRRSRAWFQVWFGALSYLLACSACANEEPRLHSELPEADFKAVLREAGFPEAWTDELLVSPIAQYTIENRRAGTIIDVLNPVPGQPSLAWLTGFGIPVWYRWGETEERLATKNPSLYDIYRPPRHLTVQYFSSLDPPPSARLLTGTALPPTTSSTTIDEQPWIAFFHRRQKQHDEMLQKETPVQRQRRLNRERDPPVKSAPVFEWWPCRDGDVYERCPVPSKLRADTLREYGSKKSRYDSFFNEWDCCDQFSLPGDPDEDDDWDDYDYIPPPIPASTETSLTKCTDADVQPPPPSYTDLDPPSDYFQLDPPQQTTFRDIVDDVEEVFGGYYGFTIPVAGTEIPSQPYPDSLKELFIRAVGNKTILPEAYLLTSHFSAAMKFFNDISSRRETLAGTWDLKDDCTRPVRLTPRFQHFRRVSIQTSDDGANEVVDAYFVFLPPKPTVPWRIAFNSALDVLTACRLPVTHTEYDMAVVFGQKGVPFRVLYPRHSIFQTPIQPRLSHEIPTRPLDHVFTKADYDSYIVRRTMLLGQPHMHAALKRGGIVWRLALGTLGLSKVSYPAANWGTTSTVVLDGAQFSDNALTRQELDIICGVYECISSDGKQRALKSWWPLTRYYEKPECGENYGHWTHRREKWYRARLEAIEADDSKIQPLSYNQWKSQQHGARPMRNFLDQVKKASLELIESHVT